MGEHHSNLPPRSEKHSSKKKNKTKNNSLTKDILSTLLYIAFLFVAFFVIQRYFFEPVVVDGDSMEPTLDHGDYLLLNKFSDIERFDIVVFPPPDEEEETLYIKRVIGMPGDTVEYRNDELYINNEPIEEDFLEYSSDDLNFYPSGNFSLLTLLGEEEVPPGQYFVLGDNRLNSRDSRGFGFVDEESIIGKVSLRYWPFEDFGFIE
ncbi:MAG TPA: signal peptidase I [Atopostipes sp.]|nr:signal peptidase I [Atopostipes sp.]